MYDGRVLELMTVFALVVGTFLIATVPWSSVLVAGAVTTAAGLAFGVAPGLWYHIALATRVSAVRALTPRWWLRPASLHEHLDGAGQRRVMPWFYAGPTVPRRDETSAARPLAVARRRACRGRSENGLYVA
jgi:hypothetical protein